MYIYIYKNAQDTSPILLHPVGSIFLVAPNSHEVWMAPNGPIPAGVDIFFQKVHRGIPRHGGTGNFTNRQGSDEMHLIWGIPWDTWVSREASGFANHTEWIGLVGKHLWDTMSCQI